MKNSISLFGIPENQSKVAKHARQTTLSSGETKRASCLGVLLVFVLFAASAVPAAKAADLFNNTNSQGVLNGYNAPWGTPFTLNQPAQITELVTYHWNNGLGTPNAVGVLSIWTTSRRLLLAVHARGVAGQGGVVANWVADLNNPLYLPAGTYILDDSSHDTWSHNSGTAGCLSFAPSFQCGFAIVRGNYVAPPPPPVVLPPGPQALGFPYRCDHNSGAAAFILDPCTGKPRQGVAITIQTERALPSSFTSVAFILQRCPFCFTPSAGLSITTGFSGGGGTALGSRYSVPVPAGLCGPGAGNSFNGSTWAVVPLVGGTGYGVIGRYMPDCR